MGSHDEGHVKRVVRLARHIARREGADLEVVTAAAELHDTARGHPDHARRGAEMAREILRALGHGEGFIERVVHCIEAHSFSGGPEPRTPEAKVLSDADKLDAIGAVGIARAFLYSGETGRSLEDTLRHFEDKLLKLYGRLYTRTAREIGAARHRFTLEFYRRLREELGPGSGLIRSTGDRDPPWCSGAAGGGAPAGAR